MGRSAERHQADQRGARAVGGAEGSRPLRRQFLKYFVEGNFLGTSVLSRPACEFARKNNGSWIGGATIPVGEFEYPSLFVRGHQLLDRLLIIVLNNESKARAVELESDLSLWLPQAKSYRVTGASDALARRRPLDRNDPAARTSRAGVLRGGNG